MNLKRIIFILLCLCFVVQAGYSVPPAVCPGQVLALPTCASDYATAYPGGSWSSSNMAVATVNSSTGIVTTVSAGITTISYYQTDICGVHGYGYTVTVNPAPAAIAGPAGVCVGANVLLNSGPAGGTWTSSTTSIGTIGAGTGVAGGVSAGNTTITYTLPTGCYTTRALSVYPAPGPISGPTTACIGATLSFTDATLGGTWSSSNSAVVDIDAPSGYAHALSAGTAIISYTGAFGCAAFVSVTVSAPAVLSVCEVSPVATCDNAFTYCGDGMVMTVSGASTGSTYSWSPSIGGYSSSSSSVSGGIVTTTYTFTSTPPAGSYTITSTGGCSTPKVINIVVPTGACNPCQTFHPCTSCEGCPLPSFKTLVADTLDGTVISTSGPGYYFVNNDAVLTVSPAPGSVFVMNRHVDLTVPGGTTVALNNCHLLSPLGCRWDGVRVIDTSAIPGKLTVAGNTLIENAYRIGVGEPGLDEFRGAAVSLIGKSTSGSAVCVATWHPSGNIFTSSDAIFNNNNVSVGMVSYSNQPMVPFRIENTIFTNRDFSCYNNPEIVGSLGYYPYVWPSVNYLKTPNLATGVTNDPGLKIDNFAGIPAYPGIPLDGVKYGVDLSDIGRTVFGPSNDYTSSFYLGDQLNGDRYNLFDTLSIGVRTIASNLVCYNNMFRRIPQQGIIAVLGGSGGSVPYTNRNRNTLRLMNGAPGTHNRFYDCREAVTGSVYNLIARNTLMCGTNYSSSVTPTNFGFRLDDTAFDMHQILFDTIRNIPTGVSEACSYPTNHNNGSFNIANNVIEGLINSSSNEVMDFGIDFSRACPMCTTVNGNVNITGNRIAGAEIGIRLNSHDMNAIIGDNNITLRSNSSVSIQTGIEAVTSQYVSSISNNTISGDVVNGVAYNAPLGSYSASTLITSAGIRINNVTNYSSFPADVSCNTTRDVPAGFIFRGQSLLNWRKNTMTRNRFGMVMQGLFAAGSEAIIGTQGSACAPNDNVWDAATGGGWPGWGGYESPSIALFPSDTIYHTYNVQNDAATAGSDLYVRSGALFTPVYNKSYGYMSGAYIGGSTVHVTSGCEPAFEPCSGGLGGRAANDGDTRVTAVIRGGSDDLGSVTVMPNPSNGDISIKGNIKTSSSTVKIEIVGMTGKVLATDVATIENGSISKNISLPKHIANGMYMVRVMAGDASKVLKFELMR